MSSALQTYINSYGLLSPDAVNTIMDQFEIRKVKKGELYIREGQVCKYLGFVESGLMMYYQVAENGQESISDFAEENAWVSQYQSFINRQPSGIYIKALEHCTLQVIGLDALTELYQRLPEFEKLSKKMVETVFMEMINRQLTFQNLRADERYQKMQLLYPSLVQRVPQYYLASYLGIAAPSLSRIRKNNTK